MLNNYRAFTSCFQGLTGVVFLKRQISKKPKNGDGVIELDLGYFHHHIRCKQTNDS